MTAEKSAKEYRVDFQQEELITLHIPQNDKSIPVPGVVVRQEAGKVLVRARIEGRYQELVVKPEQLERR